MIRLSCSCRARARAFSVKSTAPTEIYTLSLHDALPISQVVWEGIVLGQGGGRSKKQAETVAALEAMELKRWEKTDRKSTRLNSSHLGISYAVFCLKKKKRTHEEPEVDTSDSTGETQQRA